MIQKFTLTFLLCGGLVMTQSNAQQMKLIAHTHASYHTTGNITEDSTHYYHSGTKSQNAGKYPIPEFEFMADSIYTFTYDNGSKSLVPSERKVYSYNGTDVTDIVIDSFKNGSWSNDAKIRITYKSGKPDTVIEEGKGFGGAWIGRNCSIYTWTGTKIATREKLRNVYDKKTKKWNWTNQTMESYTYGSNGETEYVLQTYSGGSYQNTNKRSTTYGAGKRSQQNTYKWSGGTWTDDVRNVYSYDGQSRLVLDQQDIYTGSWEANQKDSSIFISGNTTAYRDTLLSLAFSFGNYINKGKWGFSYLPDGRMTQLFSLSWNGTDKWQQTDNQDSIDTWYYGWNLNVNEVKANNNTITVYPSPASSTITIVLDDAFKGKDIHMSVVDMQGRAVRSWIEGNYQSATTISVNELPAGNYILNADDGNQRSSERFVVSK